MHHVLRTLLLSCLLLVTLFMSSACSVRLLADESKSGSKTQKNVRTPTAAKSPALARLTADDEKQALEFAEKHHPEIADLLKKLQRSSPKGFERGIREIHTAVQRIERYRDKQPARMEAEIDNWKRDSEIRLLTARWLMSQDPVLEKRIRTLLRERQEQRIERLQAERDKLAERLQHLDNQIGMGTTELEADLTAEWDRLSRRGAARVQKTTAKPPAKVTKQPNKNGSKPNAKRKPANSGNSS